MGIETAVGAGLGLISAGASLFGSSKSKKGAPSPMQSPNITPPTVAAAPDIATPPPPANYTTYDENGDQAGSQTWDAASNSYIYKAAILTPQERQIESQKQALKTSMLGNMNKTPDEMVKAYQDYADAISKNLHLDTDFQFNKMTKAQNEGMAARGLFGSRAYVDAQSELGRNKVLSDTDIANKAETGKVGMMNADRSYWANTLNQLDQDTNARATVAQGEMRNIQAGAKDATNEQLQGYQLYNQPRIQEWQANMNNNTDVWKTQMGAADSTNRTNAALEQGNYQTQVGSNNAFAKNIGDTASGLAFLYGYENRKNNSGNSGSLSGDSGDGGLLSFP